MCACSQTGISCGQTWLARPSQAENTLYKALWRRLGWAASCSSAWQRRHDSVLNSHDACGLALSQPKISLVASTTCSVNLSTRNHVWQYESPSQHLLVVITGFLTVSYFGLGFVSTWNGHNEVLTVVLLLLDSAFFMCSCMNVTAYDRG